MALERRVWYVEAFLYIQTNIINTIVKSKAVVTFWGIKPLNQFRKYK